MNAAPDLVPALEVARMCHVTAQTILRVWRYRPGFPAPYAPGRALLWDRGEILEWLEQQRVRRG